MTAGRSALPQRRPSRGATLRPLSGTVEIMSDAVGGAAGAVLEDDVLTEYASFTLRAASTDDLVLLDLPDEGLLRGGRNGVLFVSGASDHYASVRVELHPAAPPSVAGFPEEAGPWEETGDDAFDVRGTALVLAGATGVVSDDELELPAPGRYRVRALCSGRAAAAAAVDDWAGDGDFPRGLERWLVLVWPQE